MEPTIVHRGSLVGVPNSPELFGRIFALNFNLDQQFLPHIPGQFLRSHQRIVWAALTSKNDKVIAPQKLIITCVLKKGQFFCNTQWCDVLGSCRRNYNAVVATPLGDGTAKTPAPAGSPVVASSASLSTGGQEARGRSRHGCDCRVAAGVCSPSTVYQECWTTVRLGL